MKLTNSNFEFLRDVSGAYGNKVVSLTTQEVFKFVSIMRPITECMNWKSKEDQKLVKKCVKILEQAAYDASGPDCDDLPFNL